MISRGAMEELEDIERAASIPSPTPPEHYQFNPPKYTTAIFGIIGAERPAERSEQESFLFVLRTPSKHLTLLPLYTVEPSEIARGILFTEGTGLTTPDKIVAASFENTETEMIKMEIQAIGSRHFGALFTQAWAPTELRGYRASSVYSLGSGINEIANRVTGRRAWPSTLFNIAEVYNMYPSVPIGKKGFTTPIFAETGRYATGLSGEAYWDGDSDSDRGLEMVHTAVQEIRQLVSELDFNSDVQKHGFRCVKSRRLSNFRSINLRAIYRDDPSPTADSYSTAGTSSDMS